MDGMPIGIKLFAGSMATVLLVASAPSPTAADAPATDQWAPRKCISAARISDTDILNNRTILFYKQGDVVYLNRLPGRCPGLKVAGGFAFYPSTHRLCHLDYIALPRRTGGRFAPTLGCGLGMFQPIPKALAVWLKDAQRARDEGARL